MKSTRWPWAALAGASLLAAAAFYGLSKGGGEERVGAGDASAPVRAERSGAAAQPGGPGSGSREVVIGAPIVAGPAAAGEPGTRLEDLIPMNPARGPMSGNFKPIEREDVPAETWKLLQSRLEAKEAEAAREQGSREQGR